MLDRQLVKLLIIGRIIAFVSRALFIIMKFICESENWKENDGKIIFKIHLFVTYLKISKSKALCESMELLRKSI